MLLSCCHRKQTKTTTCVPLRCPNEIALDITFNMIHAQCHNDLRYTHIHTLILQCLVRFTRHSVWHLIHRRSRIGQSRNCLFERDDLRRKLRDDAFENRSIDTWGIRRRLNGIVCDDKAGVALASVGLICAPGDNLHVVVQVEEPIRRAQDDTRSTNATENDGVDALRPQNIL